MRIQHNMMAMTANRFFQNNNCHIKHSMEKLSSGYRINRAADDAAGLTISEKMRGQIRGLNRASENIQDGISLIQTAEGSLQETHSILQRMRELSVQAANDTYVEADRKAIQKEIEQLTEEVDRIANHTEFNNGIYPLLGGDLQNDMMKYLNVLAATVTCPIEISYDGVTYQPGTPFKVAGVLVKDYLRPEKGGIFEIGFSGGTVNNEAELIKLFANFTQNSPQYKHYTVTKEDFYVDEEGRIYYLSRSYLSGISVRIYYKRCDYGVTWSNKDDPDVLKVKPEKSAPLCIQAGANTNQSINISLVDATAAGIGLNDVSVLSSEEAGNAIQTIDNAISQVSQYRSDFGAQQNRLEHAMSVDDNTAENLQAAESRIRDTDMADEIVENIKLTILEQYMQIILANANSQSESALALLL